MDIVRDVINASSVEWVAEHLVSLSCGQWLGILRLILDGQFSIPLKTDAYPEGLYTESELYDILAKLVSFSLTRKLRRSFMLI